jgi:hypothetical protein
VAVGRAAGESRGVDVGVEGASRVGAEHAAVMSNETRSARVCLPLTMLRKD